MKNLTPMMQQYMNLKSKFKDTILFFRLGDFYEMFFDDAILASRELEIALTQRDCGMEEKAPMCGIPHHVADSYISRLVSKGYKVAIGEQVEDASQAKGLVKRDVIKVITPGTITDTSVLEEKANNYLASIYLDHLGVGFSYVDNSTGEIYTTEYMGRDKTDNFRFVLEELGKVVPKELILNSEFINMSKDLDKIKNKITEHINIYDLDNTEMDNLNKIIEGQFNKESLNKEEQKNKTYSNISIVKLLDYLHKTQKTSLEHINNLVFYQAENYMNIDMNTRSNLEIYETILTKQKKGSLLHVVDETTTAMGGRLLRRWLEQPLLDRSHINKRLNMVEYFFNNLILMDDIRDSLNSVYDMERLSSKISNGNVNARDLVSLKKSLDVIPDIKEFLISTEQNDLINIANSIDTLRDIFNLLESSIDESPPITLKDGGMIKTGYNEELDKLRAAGKNGKQWLADLEAREKEASGIRNLKIGYNRIAGYYIEVTKANLSLVPDYFIRKQTLTNSERYYTNELKDMESTILGALEKSLEVEYNLFIQIRDEIKNHIKRIQDSAKLISKIDAIISLARSAHINGFVRPSFNTQGKINIVDGRHPVVENIVSDHLFVPNDTRLDLDKNMIQIITGPNMAGKSTYMRQVAIIVLLAHIGSFVPAKSADISIVDRIFTRIGAADNLSQGESTFMVEMNEVAYIVEDASQDSLIILDEVGRGTSTYDGLSIAWAVVEYIANNIKAKTLFATHYHELTQLEKQFDSITNLTISVEERGKEINFLRKIIEGSTNKSYGIQVARLAGINESIINRANEILSIIEGSHEINIDQNKANNSSSKQLSLIDYKKDYFLDKVSKIDINQMTPMEALATLDYLVKDAESIKEN